MGIVIRDFLNSKRVVACKKCKTHLTDPNDLMSKDFQGTTGRAFLYKKVINVNESADMDRALTTGDHKIRELSCCYCQIKLGWKYIDTSEPSQKYKVGHYILEQFHVQEVENEFADCPAINGFVELGDEAERQA